MGNGRPNAKAELIDQVAAMAMERAGPGAQPFATFLERYYETVAADDLAGRSAADLYGAGVAQWRLAQRRRPGETLVSVYSPTPENDGWQSPHTVVDVVIDDMPFLVDSVTMEISRHRLGIHLVVHPLVAVRRDPDGELLEASPGIRFTRGASPGARTAVGVTELREAFIHVEVTRTSREEAASLQEDVLRVLADVRSAVEDWQAMRGRADEMADELLRDPPPLPRDEVEEGAELLRWLADDHFIFLGYREYVLEEVDGAPVLSPEASTGLGILRPPPGTTPPGVRLSHLGAAHAHDPQLLLLTKANSRATVHRPSRLDYIGVRTFGRDGRVTGERRFLGLFRASAYTTLVSEIPVVRRKVAAVISRAGFAPGSHGEKSLVDVLETYPRDELIQASEEELYATTVAVAGIQERQQVRLFTRVDPFGRFVSCLVYLPRDRYTTVTVRKIGELLESAIGGTSEEPAAYLSESVLVRLHYVVHTDAQRPRALDVAELQEQVADVTRSWEEDLLDALVERCGEEEGTRLHERYRSAFPPGYRDDFPARAAVADILRIERLEECGGLVMSLYHPLDAPEALLRLKLVGSGTPVSLSDIVPVLEHMGVRVADEHPYAVVASTGAETWIYDFGLLVQEAEPLSSEKVGTAFQEAVSKALRGEVESDGFNRLVLSAGLTWREVVLLRAGCKYLRQTQTTFSQAYMEDTLARHPDVARQLVDLFQARFDPARPSLNGSAAEQLAGRISRAIDAVDSLDEDRILRRYLHLFQAMIRTNYFQRDADGGPKDYLSFKVDGSKLVELPAPRPAFEIFVYSPRTEGVHLRAGYVARGGIRWSDRREDFRTEILGLMKAQTVKNAVIVPTGAKGGFVVKRPPADRDQLMAEGVACYQALISGMLDLTDNLVEGRAKPPPDVVRYDGDDAYLVVAADKGTATLSDVANAISLDRGFWLGDAFASGGRTGYDHKALAITARGVWESVRHHFWELGIDADSTEITVVGIGDMSGDVFGNGMLLSPHLKLVGAFDHRHIFLDPDPDPARSFAERRRLFELSRSSWADYDPAAISPGGGVFPRTAKEVSISPAVAARLGIANEALTPNGLISALLRAPVDLLWNGGIGTYVKATHETNAEVGDRANDILRIDASELRCRVVAEGGNLGLTQRARVQYALLGGLVNTDAIDNSAGVDCSDHEVNIKILLDAIVAEGDLALEQRNQLLEDMAEDVCELVLQDNREQNRALGNAKSEAAGMVDVHARYLRSLEEAGKLDRSLEFLPTDEELRERAAAGRGLTVPEFAVLLAYVKHVAYGELLASDAPDEPHLRQALLSYFPARVQFRFAEQVGRHPLRREIVATYLANDVVNFGGTSMLFRIGQETGAAIPDIVRAHVTAREVYGAEGLRAEIDASRPKLTAASYVAMVLEERKLIERATRWFLRHGRGPIDVDVTVVRFQPHVQTLVSHLPEMVGSEDRRRIYRIAGGFVAAGAPESVARKVASLDVTYSALDIVEVAERARRPAGTVAAVYFGLGEELDLDWLRDHLAALGRADRWQELARDALRDDFYELRSSLTELVLASGDASVGAVELVEGWTTANEAGVRRARAVLADVKSAARSDLATLSVAVRELRSLVEAAGGS